MQKPRDGRLVEFSFSAQLAGQSCPVAVARLIRQSWSEHIRSGVSGVLRVVGARIDQTLEGPSPVVLPLATQVLTDRRYGWIRIHAFGPLAARRHADWSVEGFLPPALDLPDACDGLRIVDFSRRDPAGRGGHVGQAAAAL
jgi:hypothetical protein